MVGKNIKQRREYLGFTQSKLAKRTKLTPAAISQIESGKRLPNLKSFAAIADALNVTLDDLYNQQPMEFIDIKIYKAAIKDLETKIKTVVRGFKI